MGNLCNSRKAGQTTHKNYTLKANNMSYILVRQESPVLFIGQAPAQQDDPASPLSGRTGCVLAELMGLSLEEFLDTFDRANLFNKFPGKHSINKGDKFPVREAARNAHLLVQNNPIYDYRAIVILGKNVAKALGYKTDEWMIWQSFSRPWVCVLPHPSGIVQWWNSNRNRKAAKLFLTEMYDTYYGRQYDPGEGVSIRP